MTSRHRPRGEEVAIERVIQVATSGFTQAIDIAACVSLLGYSNRPDVDEALEKSGAAMAAGIVQKALFQRLLLWTMVAFDPVRRGDYHLRAGIEQLADSNVMTAIAARGDRKRLRRAISLFAAIDGTSKVERLRHIRNKESAHRSARDPNITPASIRDLFEVASTVSRVAEDLANGAGVVSLSLESQLVKPIDSAIAFWRPWLKDTAETS